MDTADRQRSLLNIKKRGRPIYRPIYHRAEQGWISWLMHNRIVMIIILILFVIIVVPWLVCDVMGLKPICTIISGLVKAVAWIFNLIGLN